MIQIATSFRRIYLHNLILLFSISTVIVTHSHASAQIVFDAGSLSNRIGTVFSNYLSSDNMPSNALAGSSGPQTWDFSQPQNAAEIVDVMTLIAPSLSSYASLYPSSTLAIAETNANRNSTAWSFYSIGADGRSYYGFVDADSNPQQPEKVFNPPTIDLPETIHFGDNWSRQTAWTDTINFGPFVDQVDFTFTAKVSVNAYGTLLLPIGPCNALRVTEAQEYDSSDVTSGIALPTEYLMEVYWIVPGLGKVVDITSIAYTSPAPQAFTPNTVLRTFQVTLASSQRTPVAGLRIGRTGTGQLQSFWNSAPGAVVYLLESITNLESLQWVTNGEVTGTSWQVPELGKEGFLKVSTLR